MDQTRRRPDSGRSRFERRLLQTPGLRSIPRPREGGEPFDLHYVRTGPRTERPILMIPGGPGLASVAPYAGLRSLATARGLDVLMVEHRGVGLSRRTPDGAHLSRGEVTVEHAVADLAAVLDAEGIERVVVYGSSYGTYLAQGLGLRHPQRVAGMVLDSPTVRLDDRELALDHVRGLLWEGRCPETAVIAELLRRLVGDGLVSTTDAAHVARTVYEAAGAAPLLRLLTLLHKGRGHRSWTRLAALGRDEISTGVPYRFEFDLVAAIGFGELGFGLPADDHPFQPDAALHAAAGDFPEFTGEPFDLVEALPAFSWPTAVITGERDLRTPRPVAERAARLLPDGVLVPLAGTGHSALDTHQLAALAVARVVGSGGAPQLPARAAAISRLPRRGPAGLLGALVTAQVAVAGMDPRR